ncbi:MAG TPA: cyclodeaminase/cyclohydrolase family protein [Bacteroidia bacterium]|jgi:formiminotetrahydrofolate cyclodeaminase/Zn-dependent peptidase ImmA (M78 family)|nr:cyclodeaminase/cyclohydrolase family protein [Bacteroidia bacterium]
MKKDLLDYTAKELLEKFGAGNHTPGSGSAAAFHAMSSAKLLLTVIQLSTKEKRRKDYGVYFKEFYEKEREIVERIYPELEKYFEEDSRQFDISIELRNARNLEQDPVRKSNLINQALLGLKDATVIPIKIAELCRDLAHIAAFLFQRGFQAARGDSCVALNSAVSSLGGCLSITDLNLLSFGSDEWTQNIRKSIEKLKIEYEELRGISTKCFELLNEESIQNGLYHKEINELLKTTKSKKSFTNLELEEAAMHLQNIVWDYRDLIWKSNKPETLLETINPEIVFRKTLGFQFRKQPKLGISKLGDEGYEVAGIINQREKIVEISELFNLQEQNFTAAHELGHAILHNQVELHRDRSIDGAEINSRVPHEYQADKFAAFFLMPADVVREIFQSYFLSPKFIISDESAYNLIRKGHYDLRKKCKDMRGLSLLLASANEYPMGRLFNPLAKVFNVSPGAMAIRLEELGLIEF